MLLYTNEILENDNTYITRLPFYKTFDRDSFEELQNLTIYIIYV